LLLDGETGVFTKAAAAGAARFGNPELAATRRVASSIHSTFGAIDSHGFYLDRTQLAALNLPAPEILALVSDCLADDPAVAVTIRAEDLAAGRFRPESLEARMARSFHPTRSGDLLFALREGYQSGAAGPGFATSHGTPYQHDRSVPVLFAGPGFKRGLVFAGDVSPTDIVPTLCERFGILPPPLCSGRVLVETLVDR
jgi:predicted AlkP superfamily pyrophosphatase or phosphodiesterase